MARVTIERALNECENRYELVYLASYRAHAIANGSCAAVNSDNKFAVLALREFENGKIDINALKDIIIKKHTLETQAEISNDAFIADDHSVKYDNDVVDGRNKNDNKTNIKNSLLNVDENFFA